MAEIKQYIFFDFEMLCSNRGLSFKNMEAIRLGAVKYDINSEKITPFDRYISPVNRAPLSDFCKNLTGIEDYHLSDAANFKEVFRQFLLWVNGIEESRFFSWSKSDLLRLVIDAEAHNISDKTIRAIDNRYVDFQAIFTKRVTKQHFSVERALQLYGLEFFGSKHNPMFDAYNTLRIYLNFLQKPFETDVAMLKQYIFQQQPFEITHINNRLKSYVLTEISLFLNDLKIVLPIKEAYKLIKRLKRMVDKYENILLNRSGIFSIDLIMYLHSFLRFSEDLLKSFHYHFSHSSKIMILDESIIRPMSQLSLK